jgi:hypothetical protein
MTPDTRNELLNAGWKYETNGVWSSPDDPPLRYGESNAEAMLIHAWKASKRKTTERFSDPEKIAIAVIVIALIMAGAALLGIYTR